MVQIKRVLCAECAREKALLEAGGGIKVLSCEPDPQDPRFCKLEFEYTFVPGGQAGGGGTTGSPPAGKDK